MNKILNAKFPPCQKNEKVLERYFKIMFKCDRVRFINPLEKEIFLVLGTLKNTKEDNGTWSNEDKKLQNWDYFEESTIASGKTIPELISNAKRYKTLRGKRAIDLLLEEIKGKR